MKRLPDARPYFAEIEDPRRETRNKLYKLEDIIMIVLCAVLSDIKDWVRMGFRLRERSVAAGISGAAGRHPVARHAERCAGTHQP